MRLALLFLLASVAWEAAALHTQSRTVLRPNQPMVARGRRVLPRPTLGVALFSPSSHACAIGAQDMQIHDQKLTVTLAWQSPFEVAESSSRLPTSVADECTSAARQAANAALSAGMGYAGVPPSRPTGRTRPFPQEV